MKKVLFFAIFLDLSWRLMSELDMREVGVMKEIGKKFGKKEWDWSLDLCGDLGIWEDYDFDEAEKEQQFDAFCDCSYEDNTVCHLEHIKISLQNISITPPLEFTKFKHLKTLDLSNNYISGTIPSKWANMRLNTLKLTGNRLSGPFPTLLTRITSLTYLDIERNLFSGSIPKEIGNLKNLKTLALSSNGFTGQLPPALAKLTNLTAVKISDNNFSGKIPNFISKWTHIKRLHMEGCSFEGGGNFLSSISALTKLNDLRISNLKGTAGASTFPSLDKVNKLTTLVLRNCLIRGTIPDYVGNMTRLETLDLSFNNLTGIVPLSFSGLQTVKHMYLTKNNLSGPMPQWILLSIKEVDVSYNQFTWDASAPKSCVQSTINVVESYSSSTNEGYSMDPCLRKDFPCTKSNAELIHSLHINCGGGPEKIYSSIIYEGDTDRNGASSYHSGSNWAFSSTGNFLDSDTADSDVYILANTSSLNNISVSDIVLYTKARTSAISLTYYGLCLMNGNYTVKLHFAEIVFTQDSVHTRHGKRAFDVYVQGELKIKDFDIVKEAGGAGIAVIKSYTVIVKHNTLKIQLYWAGKGTTGIPKSGNYGPIISAISVQPNFEIPNFGKKVNVGLIVGTVVPGLLFVILVIFILWRKGYIMRAGEVTDTNTDRDTDTDTDKDKELRGIDLTIGIFTLKQLKAATNNFDPSNKLGEGGFGAVYKGELSDGTLIAVKQLSSKSNQGAREFVNEITIVYAQRHPNLVRLHGSCVEENQMSLVYEYMQNNCLARLLFGSDKRSKAKLTWPVRVNICIGIARGLLYLHEESKPPVIHRDTKASNILLDENFNAKISDFGLAKLNDDEDSHVITRIAGTVGYMAPEYALRGYLTNKADIYSFGIVLLEILTGKSNNYTKHSNGNTYFLRDWAEGGNVLELVDPDLESLYSLPEASTILKLSMWCTDSCTNRPTISQAINVLEGKSPVPEYQKGSTSQNQSWQDRSETRSTIVEQFTESFVLSPSSPPF